MDGAEEGDGLGLTTISKGQHMTKRLRDLAVDDDRCDVDRECRLINIFVNRQLFKQIKMIIFPKKDIPQIEDRSGKSHPRHLPISSPAQVNVIIVIRKNTKSSAEDEL